MIDLTRFTEVKTEVIPIVEGWGQIDSRRIEVNIEDGWYLVRVGEKVTVERKATLTEVAKSLKTRAFLRVYAFGNEGIPVNFDNFFRRGFGEAVKIWFLNLPVFEVAKVVLWEDRRFYFYESDIRYEKQILQLFKERMEKVGSSSGNAKNERRLSGITPELSYYALLVDLSSQAYREADELNRLKLSSEERDKRIKQFQNTFPERLEKIIENAGGKLVKFSKSNADSYLVHWKINGQIVKSTIRDDLGILSAGFCLSGADKEHSMSSLIQLAKMFQERAPLYITRD